MFDKVLWLRCRTLQEERTLLGCLTEIRVLHLGESLWCIVDFGRLAAPGAQHGSVVRKLADIHRCRAGAGPTKTLHATRYIGLETDAGLLAIVANVDAHFELLHDDPLHCSLYLPL